ncbi:hypothetical protein [Undibacterium sp. SXout20W]|uniref:hypothetical protein n=1 Tax=Undibacterium sp. SXout20W TaxID=3413051 RepID=UPI003BF41386
MNSFISQHGLHLNVKNSVITTTLEFYSLAKRETGKINSTSPNSDPEHSAINLNKYQ